MNYVKTVKNHVEQLHERIKAIEADIANVDKASKAGSIGPKTAAEKIADLKAQRDADVIATHREILSFKEKFKEAAEKASLIDGSMNNSDAVIFQSGVKLTEQQFNALVERNKKNPFVIALAHKYAEEHEEISNVANLPPRTEQIIANFNEFADVAASMCYESPESIRVAMFFQMQPDPEGAESIE